MKDSLTADNIAQIKSSFGRYMEIQDRKANLKEEEASVKQEVAEAIDGTKTEGGKLLKYMKEIYDKGNSSSDEISTLVQQIRNNSGIDVED